VWIVFFYKLQQRSSSHGRLCLTEIAPAENLDRDDFNNSKVLAINYSMLKVTKR